MKKWKEEDFVKFFEDEAIEFDDLFDFLKNHKDLKMDLKFDGPELTIKLELVDM